MNSNTETKVFNSTIKGKDGGVSTYSIQRHLPSTDMMLITTESTHSIFCQENHPLFIKRNNEIIEISASDIRLSDELWVNNEITNNPNCMVPSREPEEIIDIIISMIEYNDVGVLDRGDGILRGKTLNTFRFEPDYINYDKMWLGRFIYLIDINNLRINASYNFTSQLKLICDRIGMRSHIDLLEHPEETLAFELVIDSVEYPDTECMYTGYSEISGIDKTSLWRNNYVYDIKTNTKEYMLNCVQNHNTFHLGGAVVMKNIDIIDELMDSIDNALEPSIKSKLMQVDNDIILKDDYLMLTIDKSIYDKAGVKIEEKGNEYHIPVGHFDMIIGDLEVRSAIERPTIVHKTSEIEIAGNYINISYTRKSKVFTVNPVVEDFTKLAQSLDGLVGGKSPWSDVPSLYRKFFKLLSIVGSWDSVHLEVIISNILRSAKDPQKPARLVTPFEPKMYSIKHLPGVISWPLGLGFENFSQAIANGMVAERGPESSIEKVMFGQQLSDLEGKKK